MRRARDRRRSTTWPGPAIAKPGADGKLPAVGNTVDVANATYTNSIGAPQLAAVWKDPEFDRSLTGGLLRARAGDPDAALDGVRRQALQREDAQGSADGHAGARVHLADLVHAARLRQRDCPHEPARASHSAGSVIVSEILPGPGSCRARPVGPTLSHRLHESVDVVPKPTVSGPTSVRPVRNTDPP